jgi:hypothetical protein
MLALISTAVSAYGEERVPDARCEFYFSESTGQSDLAKRFEWLRGGIFGWAVEVCDYPDGLTDRYIMYSAPKPGLFGTCYVTMERIFEARDSKGNTWWTPEPPSGASLLRYRGWKAVAGVESCPRVDDARYVELAPAIAEGVFVEFSEFLARAQANHEVFEQAAESLDESSRSSTEYRSLLRSVRAGTALKYLSLRLVDVPPHYVLEIAHGKDVARIYADLRDGKVRFLEAAGPRRP